MRFNIFTTAGLVPCTLAVSVAPVGRNDTALHAHAVPDPINFKFTEAHVPALESLFTTICAIPDDTLFQGNEATHEWLVNHGFRDPNAVLMPHTASELSALEPRGLWGIATCIAAIVTAIATTAFPPAKLLKIKKLVDAAGGIKAAAQLLLGARKIKAAGQLAANLAGEVLGISTIAANCAP